MANPTERRNRIMTNILDDGGAGGRVKGAIERVLREGGASVVCLESEIQCREEEVSKERRNQTWKGRCTIMTKDSFGPRKRCE